MSAECAFPFFPFPQRHRAFHIPHLRICGGVESFTVVSRCECRPTPRVRCACACGDRQHHLLHLYRICIWLSRVTWITSTSLSYRHRSHRRVESTTAERTTHTCTNRNTHACASPLPMSFSPRVVFFWYGFAAGIAYCTPLPLR